MRGGPLKKHAYLAGRAKSRGAGLYPAKRRPPTRQHVCASPVRPQRRHRSQRRYRSRERLAEAAPAPPRAAKVTGEGGASRAAPSPRRRLTARSRDQRSLTPLGLFLSPRVQQQARERACVSPPPRRSRLHAESCCCRRRRAPAARIGRRPTHSLPAAGGCCFLAPGRLLSAGRPLAKTGIEASSVHALAGQQLRPRLAAIYARAG